MDRRKKDIEKSDKNGEKKPERTMTLRDEIRRFFDEDWGIEAADFWRKTPRFFGKFTSFPRVDISENDAEVKVSAELPGVDPGQVDVEIGEKWMRLRGRIERENASHEKPYRYERSYGEFEREFTLPSHVKENEARAFYKDGVLTVTVPKQEEKKRKIKIERD